jgi:hypothetical protein
VKPVPHNTTYMAEGKVIEEKNQHIVIEESGEVLTS